MEVGGCLDPDCLQLATVSLRREINYATNGNASLRMHI